MMHRRDASVLAAFSFAATALLALFFTTFPGIDLIVSRLFGTAEGFPLSQNPVLQVIRGLIRLSTEGTAIVVILLTVAALVGRNLTSFTRGTLIFASLAWIALPGLLVNGLLKAQSGRARPRHIAEFGGDKSFTPPLQLADQCGANCSFVSGEASALAAFALLVTILLWSRLSARRFILLWTAALLGSLLRVGFGGHFLSDVAFAWGITISLIALGWALLPRPAKR